MPECINKLQKQDLNDAKLFFEIEYDKLESTVLDGLKPEGKKFKIKKKLKEIRDKYEKDGFIEYTDQGLLEMPSEVPALKFQKSTTLTQGRSSMGGKNNARKGKLSESEDD